MAGYKIVGLAKDNSPKTGSYKIQGKAKEIPEEEDEGAYLDNLPSGKGFFSKLPRNIAIGLAGLQHKVVNTPYELGKGIESGVNQIGANINQKLPLPNTQSRKPSLQEIVESFNKKNNVPEEMINPNWNKSIAEHIPHQEEHDFAKMLGQEGEGTIADKLIQKGIEYAPELYAGKGLLQGAFKRLIGTHQLNKVRQVANELNIPDFGYTPETIAQAKAYLPKGESTINMIKGVKSGEYNPSFSMQSQIGAHERALEKSILPADRLLAPQLGDLKKNMIGQLQNTLIREGLTEEAKLLETGINKYAKYMKVKEAIIPVLKKYGIPTSVLAAIGFGFDKAKKALAD